MRTARMFVCLTLLTLFAGCDSSDTVVGSVQPLFTSADLVFDTALAGVWRDPGEDSSEVIVFEPSGQNAYTMILRDREGREETRYEARLVDLHDEAYLDILPETPSVRPQDFKLDYVPLQMGNDFTPHLLPVADQVVASIEADASGERGRDYKVRFIRLHWFYKVRTDGRVMRLTGLDPEWLLGEIKEGRILIEHEELRNDEAGLVLSAPTGDLQQLVLDYSFDPKAFPEDGGSNYERAPEE
jgi:hypothetical protein